MLLALDASAGEPPVLIMHRTALQPVLTIAYLSIPVVNNLLQRGGSRQVMNTSFGAFRLVNTYGAFGNVGQARYEAVVSVTHDGQTWQTQAG